MDLPEHLYNWLQNIGIIPFNEYSEPGSYLLPEEILFGLESGDSFTMLVKHLNQIKVTVT